MLQVSDHEQVTCFKMGTELGGQVHYWCAAYLVDDVLVDSGCAHTAQELLQALKDRPLRAVVNTHGHEDHYGANALLARERGVELYAPQASLEAMARRPELYPYQELMWGYSESCHPQPVPAQVPTAGHVLHTLELPGHSPDFVAYWEPDQGWAFVSDLWVAPKQKTSRDHENSRQIIASMKKLLALEPRVMFTGLGQVVTDPIPALKETIAWLEEMQAQIMGLVVQGKEPQQIVAEMFGRESSLKQMTQDQLSYENFVRSFLKGA